MKVQFVVDDAAFNFKVMSRRTPFVGGSKDACGIIGLEIVTPLTWGANPDPVIATLTFDNADNAAATLFGWYASVAWYKRGLGGAAYTSVSLENPGAVCGSATADPGGVDQEPDLRWVFAVGILGTSTMFKGLQPFRSPIVGIDAGATLDRAAFGGVTVANDGVALAS